jgi:hypothetical protein
MATVVSAAARFRLVFFVPPSALEACKTAIFAAGAGRYPGPGNYTECCWTAMGTGLTTLLVPIHTRSLRIGYTS